MRRKATKALLPRCLRNRFSRYLNEEQASICRIPAISFLPWPGPSLTAFWRKVRGRSRVTKHRLILLESATRDSFPRPLERKLPNAFSHGQASISDKLHQKSI